MSRTSGSAAAWLSAITILVSAFLLFQVQPLISKAILPWFGGSPAVWSTCVLFFQLALLVGYAYAHWLNSTQFRWKYVVHGVLLAAAICVLPIIPADRWKPIDGRFPTGRILWLLTAHVGLTYFLLSSTGPLVQAWFAKLYPQRSPYRLYALSNIGSLGALVSYPFVFEPNFSVRQQGWGWSAGFALFALLAGSLCWLVARGSQEPPLEETDPKPTKADLAHEPPPLWQIGLWLGLAALGTTALLAVTNHLCQDIAVTSFFWIVPLSLYLLSFILVFDRDWWYQPWAIGLLVVFATLFVEVCKQTDDFDRGIQTVVGFCTGKPNHAKYLEPVLEKVLQRIDPDYSEFNDSIPVNASVYLLWFFALCMLCHGEISRLKPARPYLTKYYLMIAAGGALGGMFVSLVCPRIFREYTELPLSLGLGAAVALGALVLRYTNPWTTNNSPRSLAGVFFAVGLLLIVAGILVDFKREKKQTQVRNFYGVLSVKSPRTLHEEDRGTGLYHGRILHGYQYDSKDRRHEPTTYYAHGSGVQIAVEHFPNDPREQFRLAVVGLGSGTMAAYGREGDFIRFYEIDSKVVEISDKYFSFVKDSAAEVDIALGDARVSLEREDSQDYNVIALDAFSGDAIPVHLLTKEAAAVYFRHLKPGGILAIHTSNRFLNLVPVAHGLAREFGYKVVYISAAEHDDSPGTAASDWVLLTKNEQFLADPKVVPHVVSLLPNSVLWTDQRSDLYRILK